jgi:hypothetical protein
LSNEDKEIHLIGLTRVRNELFAHILGNNASINHFLRNICPNTFDAVVQGITNYYQNQYDSTTVVSGGTIISQIYDSNNDN